MNIYSATEEAYKSGYEKGRMDALTIPTMYWIYKPFGDDDDIWLYHCSCCGTPNANERNFCPECGSKADLEATERVYKCGM